MERTNDEEEHAHDVFVALEHLVEGETNFGLDLVRIEEGETLEFEEYERERDEGEDEKEEENVVTVEEVIGFGGGVVEPERLGEGEVAA